MDPLASDPADDPVAAYIAAHWQQTVRDGRANPLPFNEAGAWTARAADRRAHGGAAVGRGGGPVPGV